MSNRTNPDYLRNYQYSNAHNLDARINLHRRFSTNPEDWFRWVFDRLPITAYVHVLELGCGSGMLWKHNLDRIPANCHIHLSDFSFGMLRGARQNNEFSPTPLSFSAFDAQAIPYPDTNFDLVVANHMLYHIPNRSLALSEIHRVLKHSGKLIAATNGKNHMVEVQQLLLSLDPTLAYHTDHAFGVNEFTIENGTSQLSPWFTNLNIIPFESALEVTEVKPLVEYILSMNVAPHKKITRQQIDSLHEFINNEINLHGSFHISKSTALFVGDKS